MQVVQLRYQVAVKMYPSRGKFKLDLLKMIGMDRQVSKVDGKKSQRGTDRRRYGKPVDVYTAHGLVCNYGRRKDYYLQAIDGVIFKGDVGASRYS